MTMVMEGSGRSKVAVDIGEAQPSPDRDGDQFGNDSFLINCLVTMGK